MYQPVRHTSLAMSWPVVMCWSPRVGAGPAPAQHPGQESLWARMRTGLVGGIRRGDKPCPRPGLQDPRVFPGCLCCPLSGDSVSLRRRGRAEGGPAVRASAASCRHRPPVPVAKERPWPHKPPLRSSVTPHGDCARSPGLVRGLFLRVGTSCLPGPAVAPTDPAHGTARTSTACDTFIA